MAENPYGNVVSRWTSSADDLSPRRLEMKRLADAGRLVIERMASTDAPHEAVERAAELLEAAARELDGPGKPRRYLGFAESANAGGDPHAHFDHSPIMGMASPLAAPTRIESGGSPDLYRTVAGRRESAGPSRWRGVDGPGFTKQDGTTYRGSA